MGSLQKIAKVLSKARIARFTYLTSFFVMVMGISMMFIMLASILIPYLGVKDYLGGVCTVNGYDYRVKIPWHTLDVVEEWPICEPKTSTNIRYPCGRIYVNYTSTPIEGDNITISHILLHEDEYNFKESLKSNSSNCTFWRCSTMGTWENQQRVYKVMKEYSVRGKSFKCLYDPNNLATVIVRRAYDFEAVMKAVCIPGGLAVLAVIMIGLFYLCIGCDVWSHRVSTSQWEKSFSTMEMEQTAKKANMANSTASQPPQQQPPAGQVVHQNHNFNTTLNKNQKYQQ